MDAFVRYRATRLSAIIFNLRKYGYNIVSKPMTSVNSDGEVSHYVKYVFIESEEK